MSALKYTDHQVARREDLFRRIATEYIQEYTGSFDLLRDYKLRLQAGHPLSIPMIRATLNCMRYDAQVVGLPEPEFEARDYSQGRSARVVQLRPRRGFGPVTSRWVDGHPEDDDEEEEYTPPPLPRFVKQPTRWKVTYGVSTWTTAELVHRVHTDSHIVWDREKDTRKPVIGWACSGYTLKIQRLEIVLMDEVAAYKLLTENHGRARICKKCATWYGADKLEYELGMDSLWYTGRTSVAPEYVWEPNYMTETPEQVRARLEELYAGISE